MFLRAAAAEAVGVVAEVEVEAEVARAEAEVIPAAHAQADTPVGHVQALRTTVVPR